ncbi:MULTISPECIES: hypothetical protein [Rhizobium]|uniref:hypothetical protein n=1 Tax=Rhizobium TaxID=379 RepID=UPI001FEDBED6|nr:MULTISPECIES: hypothetical protein [Rhizobium]
MCSLGISKYRSRISKLALALASTVFLSAAFSDQSFAETRPLSEINQKTEARIQREISDRDLRCYKFILRDFRSRKIKQSDILVTFDDPEVDGIGVGISETDENYSCEDGEMRAWEGGKYEVVKTFP